VSNELHLPDILRPPTIPAELDVPMLLVEQMVLRRTFVLEQTSTHQLEIDIGLDIEIVDKAFESLRNKKHVNVLGLTGSNYRFELTSVGRSRAEDAMARCSYNGITPVSLSRYSEVVQLLRAESHLDAGDVRRALADLVVSDELVDRVGPAFATQRPILLHGPSGTGKTSIAERLVRLYDDAVAIPHSVEIDGQIIVVFDPIVHRPLVRQPDGLDPRWVICERPMVVAGGELELSMLDLKRDPVSGIYMAPLQMKANNGLLVVDDFGRQMIPPASLLNRWIVPLERRVDYLTLDYGLKFVIPFELLVVFSTNIPPLELGDEAFFRRIPNKIHVGAVSADEFDQITEIALHKCGFEQNPGDPRMFRQLCEEVGVTSLRPCIPIDVCRIARSICDFERLPMHLSRAVAMRAAEMYFTAPATRTEARVAMLATPTQPSTVKPLLLSFSKPLQDAPA